MGRHDGVHGSFSRKLPNLYLITPPGMYTTAIPHRRGHRSFRRIPPLSTLGNRRRGGTAPPRRMHLPPSPLPRQTRGRAQMQRIRPRHVFDQITPRGRAPRVALAARRTRRRKRRTVGRDLHDSRCIYRIAPNFQR